VVIFTESKYFFLCSFYIAQLLQSLKYTSVCRIHDFSFDQLFTLAHIADILDCADMLKFALSKLNYRREFDPLEQIFYTDRYQCKDWLNHPITRILRQDARCFEDSEKIRMCYILLSVFLFDCILTTL
jgi:hypothetical protein